MRSAFEKRSLAVLLILSAVTVLSWWMGSRHGAQTLSPDLPITFGVLAVAALKVRLIAMEFMEARHAPRLLRWCVDGWLVLMLGALLAIYLWRPQL